VDFVAWHRRLWGNAEVSFDPLHYLALLERKPGALDYARPLVGWQSPECFLVLRRRLEAQLYGAGTREYIRVLRLAEQHTMPSLAQAVKQGLRCGGLSRDAIAQFLIPQEEWRTRRITRPTCCAWRCWSCWSGNGGGWNASTSCWKPSTARAGRTGLCALFQGRGGAFVRCGQPRL
jgi:hypothetical protein